jgi:RecB family exonuclease
VADDQTGSESIEPDPESRAIDLVPVTFGSAVARVAVTAASAGTETREEGLSTEISSRVLGRVVHQLLERFLETDATTAELTEGARRMLQRESSLDLSAEGGEIERLARRATEICIRIRSNPQVEALRGCKFLFEVPFAYHDGTTLLSGTIDCLARAADGSLTALEFKTGAPPPAHQRQLSKYVAAARALVPDARVEGRLVYP